MYLLRDSDLSFQNALKQFLQVIKPSLRERSFAKAMEIHKLSFYMEKNALSITTLIFVSERVLGIVNTSLQNW